MNGTETQNENYQRIAHAIDYLKTHFKEQPSLDDVAQQVNLSPFHFQRLFTDWAGVSPKQFVGYLSVDYAKRILGTGQATLFDAAHETGLSGTGRLHDLFVKVEGMTPGEYKKGGEDLIINYQFVETLFGKALIASTAKGVCYLAFLGKEEAAIKDLRGKFPKAVFVDSSDDHQRSALDFFTGADNTIKEIKLHLKGTHFQLKIWEALLKIPMGGLSTYGEVARVSGHASASRAVGTAVGDNPVAFIIPCHRVIRSEGTYGQYRWGPVRKSALIGWEAAKVHGVNPI